MQALALQFNLSETTFLFPSSRADAGDGSLVSRLFSTRSASVLADPATGRRAIQL